MVILHRVSILALTLVPAFIGAVPQQVPLSQTFREPQAITFNLTTSPSNSTFHDEYHHFGETSLFLEDLARAHRDNVVIDLVGYSASRRPIVAALISQPELKKDKKTLKEKPRVVMMGAQHAREWIATSTALYLAQALVTEEHDAWSLKKLLKHYDFVIIPTPNPDGYVYTWTTDRLWYKNTMIIEGSSCIGIDMNRNWPFGYVPSSSPEEGPCQPWYAGTKPFEAPEVAALATYFQQLERAEAFLDLRSYGQTISIPYSYTCDKLPPDAEDILEAAVGAAAALHAVHGTSMKATRLCQTLYSAPGNILDWMYEQKGAVYSYAVHLRDTGTYGYLLPPDRIKPVGEETTELVKYIADFIREKKKEGGKPSTMKGAMGRRMV